MHTTGHCNASGKASRSVLISMKLSTVSHTTGPCNASGKAHEFDAWLICSYRAYVTPFSSLRVTVR
jgi:hypothetical protein